MHAFVVRPGACACVRACECGCVRVFRVVRLRQHNDRFLDTAADVSWVVNLENVIKFVSSCWM